MTFLLASPGIQHHLVLRKTPTAMSPNASFRHPRPPHRGLPAFTLVELLVVIAIISILMTAGAIGIGGISGGKGVSSAVASAEALFDEARSIAVSNRTRSRVLVSKALTNNPQDNLRKILVISAEVDPNTGKEKSPVVWVPSSRGIVLPEQVYFSATFSKRKHSSGEGSIPEMENLPGAKNAFMGSYYFYEFNAEGICEIPGASFIVGTGTRSISQPLEQPRVTASAKRDFGGFVVWRNGRTSLFRSPDQMGGGVKSISAGGRF